MKQDPAKQAYQMKITAHPQFGEGPTGKVTLEAVRSSQVARLCDSANPDLKERSQKVREALENKANPF